MVAVALVPVALVAVPLPELFTKHVPLRHDRPAQQSRFETHALVAVWQLPVVLVELLLGQPASAEHKPTAKPTVRTCAALIAAPRVIEKETREDVPLRRLPQKQASRSRGEGVVTGVGNELEAGVEVVSVEVFVAEADGVQADRVECSIYVGGLQKL